MLEKEMRPAVIEWCKMQGLTPICEILCFSHYADFIAVKFQERVGRGIPKLERVVGIELKLSDYAGVLRQCRSLTHWCHEVYAVIPKANILRMKQATREKFRQDGIGMLPHICHCRIIGATEIEAAKRVLTHDEKSWKWFERKLWNRIKRDAKL